MFWDTALHNTALNDCMIAWIVWYGEKSDFFILQPGNKVPRYSGELYTTSSYTTCVYKIQYVVLYNAVSYNILLHNIIIHNMLIHNHGSLVPADISDLFPHRLKKRIPAAA